MQNRNDSQHPRVGQLFNGQMLNNVRQMLPNFGIFRQSPNGNMGNNPISSNTHTSFGQDNSQQFPQNIEQTQMPNGYDGVNNQNIQRPLKYPNYNPDTTPSPFNQQQPENFGQTQQANGFQFNNNERNNFPLPTNFPSRQPLPSSGSGSLIEIAPTTTTLLKPVDNNNFPVQPTFPLPNVGNIGTADGTNSFSQQHHQPSFPALPNVANNFPTAGSNNFPVLPNFGNSGSNSEPEVYIDENGIFQIRNKPNQNFVAAVNDGKNNFPTLPPLPPPPPSSPPFAIKTTRHPDAISFNEDQFMIDVRFDGENSNNDGTRQNSQRHNVKTDNEEDVLVFV